MADGKIDALDVGALERSVNDSATRVSGIWLSFVAFSAYLAAAASNISHRQIFLEEPIKLPTVNIDLPLVASAILLPLLFVIYHVFVLLQVVLLSRTADAYNQAVERAVPDAAERTQVRQRLANTLFAQLFAGSPREREGLLGWLLRGMAWITLAIAPVFVLLVFEIKFLPYHNAAVTWIHRGLIAVDLLAVLLLWAGAVEPSSDMGWRSLRPRWKSGIGAAFILALSCVLLTFPGEPGRGWMQLFPPPQDFYRDHPECLLPPPIAEVLPTGFDRLALVGEDFVDDDKLKKIIEVAKTNDKPPYESERTRSFHKRDLRCGRFAAADLRHADFTEAILLGASLRGARLEGSLFSGAVLDGAVLDDAQLQGAHFSSLNRPQGALGGARLERARFRGTRLEGISFEGVNLRGADFTFAVLDGANLRNAELEGATLNTTQLRRASLREAKLQRADLNNAILLGADLNLARLQGAFLNNALLQGADLTNASLQGTHLNQANFRGASLFVADIQGAYLLGADLQGARLEGASLQGAHLSSAHLQGANLGSAQLQGSELGDLRLAYVAKPFVWGTAVGQCEDAMVIAPDSSAFLRFAWERRGGRRSRAGEWVGEIAVGPKEIESFIEETAKIARPQEQARIRTDMQRQFSGERADAAKTAWQACAAGSPPNEEYEQKLVAFLLELACGTDPAQKYVTDGIIRNWIASPVSAASAQALARGLADVKQCSAAEALDSGSRERLLKAAEGKPAD